MYHTHCIPSVYTYGTVVSHRAVFLARRLSSFLVRVCINIYFGLPTKPSLFQRITENYRETNSLLSPLKTTMPPTRRRSRKKSRKVVRPKTRIFSTSSVGHPVTPPARTSTSTSEKLYDKVEFSPNALAKCQQCRRKIQKGQQRFGITEHSERYNKEIYRYYHERCCPASFKARVPFAGKELDRQRKEHANRAHLLRERNALYENLRTLRQIFARRMGYEPCIIFHNSTLEDLVVKMPKDKLELLAVTGIGPKKCENFGDPILQLIRQYKTQAAVADKMSRARPINAAASLGVVVVEDGSSDEDHDAVELAETLSCEQLVNQKFEHAAANGYVISID